jgi:hypothetical protein
MPLTISLCDKLIRRGLGHTCVRASQLEQLMRCLDVEGHGSISRAAFEAAYRAARLSAGVDVYVPTLNHKRRFESAEFKQSVFALAGEAAQAAGSGA